MHYQKKQKCRHHACPLSLNPRATTAPSLHLPASITALMENPTHNHAHRPLRVRRQVILGEEAKSIALSTKGPQSTIHDSGTHDAGL